MEKKDSKASKKELAELKKKQKEEEKRKKEEEKRKKKEEKEEKKRKAKEEKRKRTTSQPLLKEDLKGSSPSDKRNVRSESQNAMSKSSSKKRRPPKFKEREFQMVLENLRQNNKQDRELDMHNHYLDKWACEELAEVLSENKTVTALNLSNNLIGDDGIVPLSRMLEKNKSIRMLDISFNQLTRKGTRQMLNCLNNNVFLTELYMDEEVIELGTLGLGDAQLNPITPAMRDEIERILNLNDKFQLVLAFPCPSLFPYTPPPNVSLCSFALSFSLSPQTMLYPPSCSLSSHSLCVVTHTATPS